MAVNPGHIDPSVATVRWDPKSTNISIVYMSDAARQMLGLLNDKPAAQKAPLSPEELAALVSEVTAPRGVKGGDHTKGPAEGMTLMSRAISGPSGTVLKRT